MLLARLMLIEHSSLAALWLLFGVTLLAANRSVSNIKKSMKIRLLTRLNPLLFPTIPFGASVLFSCL